MIATEYSLSELVARARGGDEGAWRAIVDRFAALVWAVCRTMRLSDADAADVSQTVYLRLVEHLPEIREPAALPGWIRTTTRNECLRVLKVADRVVGVSADELLERLPDPNEPEVEAGLLAAERRAALREAFAELSEQCQRLLTLLMADKPLPYSEIATLMGRAVGGIGPTRARCIDQLREAPALRLLTDETAHRPGG